MTLAQYFFGCRFCWQGCWIQVSIVIWAAFLASDKSFGDQSLYEREIKPVLRERCFACHGALKQESGLRLDTARMMEQGGDSGAALSAGDPHRSLIMERVEETDVSLRMPPDGEPLSDQQIAALRQWISAGAPAPIDEQPEPDPQDHWAFQPIVRPRLPATDGWAQNPIDAFIDNHCARQGIELAGEATKPALLRRVTINLIGLPPLRQELHDFLNDDSPEAYEKVVERLLNDPGHGQRWARHWMDVWRYSDWYGRRDQNDVRNSAGQIYRWRDWIVSSLNSGKGYDRMIQEMLAADELFPADDEAAVATGFLIRNYYSLNPNDWMRSVVEHTGKAFLGLTFNCAHCHDHKYDPIEQEDYFKLRAFFEPLFIRQDRVVGEPDPGPFEDYTYGGTRAVQRLGAISVFDRSPDAPTWFYTDGDERNRLEHRGSVPPGVPAFLDLGDWDIQTVQLPPTAWYPGLKPEYQQILRDEATHAIEIARRDLEGLPPTPGPQNDYIDQPATISGQHSLVLDSTQNRAAIQNDWRHVLADFSDEMRLDLKLHLLQDGHFNIQLLKDSLKGHTAAYIGWNNGTLKAYVPGQPGEAVIGQYDWSSGQDQFQIHVRFQPSQDIALLTVRCTTEDRLLIDNVCVQLGGWNPAVNQNQTLFLDSQNGCVASLDDIILSVVADAGSSEKDEMILFECDFEPPVYQADSTPIGIDGWNDSAFAPAVDNALVVSNVLSLDDWHQLAQARLTHRQRQLPHTRRIAAEKKLEAAEAVLESLEARIAAENFRWLESPHSSENDAPVVEDRQRVLATIASSAERKARLVNAESDLLVQQVAIAEAEARSAEDPERVKTLQTAVGKFTSARQAVNQARQALHDESASQDYSPLSAQYPKTSTGRRRALAQWMTHPENPLTARVAVNHIWLRHFHQPLVEKVVDFGRNSDRPVFHDLLDWLAAELIDSGWDMKHIHRLIVTSQAYRRQSSSSGFAVSHGLDPENRFLWRMNTGRMEAEVVRDSLLAVSGRLDSTMGGVELENSAALTTTRRSIYYSSHPELGGKNSLGELFDAPDPLDCYRRVQSIVPQQALALTNSQFVQLASSALANRCQAEDGYEAAGDTLVGNTGDGNTGDGNTEGASDRCRFVIDAFETILSRSPTDSELELCMEIMEQQRQLITLPELSDAESEQRVRESLIRVLFSHNDFLTIR